MASILDLPAELVIEIASYLNTKELGPLRQSCKQLEQHLFETFATEFFTKRQFMIEHASLKALVDISQHPTLADRLVEVLISTDMFGYPWISDAQYAADDTSREWLLRTGQARDMLSKAFAKLKNLRIVGLRDFNSKGRLREGSEEALWRSYAWSTDMDTLPPMMLEHDRNPGTLFSLILQALGIARTYPQDMQVILRKRDTLVPHSFKINASSAQVVARLKTLFLTLHADSSTSALTTSGSEAPIRRFLHTAADLENLRLNFDSRWSTATRLLDWLGTPAASTDPNIDDPGLLNIPPAPLINLTSLELGQATVPGATLVRTLSRFKLKSFSLWRITLADRDPSQLNVDHWARFLADLSKALGNSDSIQKVIIGLLAQISQFGPHSRSWEKVQICAPEDAADKSKLKDGDLPKDVKFRARYGLSASQWLQALSERTYVRSIHAPPPSPDSDSEGGTGDQSDDFNEDDEDDEEDDDDDEDVDDDEA